MTLPDEVAIVVSDLGKRYEIYGRPHHRLLQTLLRGRRRFYREFWALRDVSLTVRRGETFGIVGPNGSGKSTLLQLVAGTLAPTLGSVTTHGRVAALLELGSGFNPEFTGRENVYLNGAILGIPRHEMKRAFTAIEAFAGIGDFIDQPVKTYSSGMVVRLAFAVAVHVTPDILIVDEALAVGDTAFQAKCLDRIRAMQRTGVAILLVSHSLNTVIEFCDRAVYLDAGRLVAIGGCRQVVQRYSDDVTQTEARSALLSQALRQEVHAPRTAPETHASLMAQAVDNASAEPALPSTQILSVTVTDAQGVPKAAFAHGDEILIAIDLMFHRSNPAPCFGIQLKSTDDISLWAVTTASLDIRPPPVDAGTRLTFIWSLRATLGGSRFVVALGVGDNAAGEYRRHDRLPYAVHFDVLPEPRGGAGWLGVSATFVDPRRPTGEAAPETAGKGSKGVTARRPSILVVMADNRRLQCRLDEADYNSMTAAINKSYCDRMGYDFSYYRVFYMDRASDDILNCKDPHSASMRHASWSKLLALQHALLTTDHDYCCYIDSDAAFINWGRRIEELIGHTEITFQNNQPFTAGPCAGFFIIKRSLLTLRFLERWYFTDAGDKNTKRTWEQSVLLPLLESGGYPYSIASELAFSDQEGQLVRHITAVGSENLRRPYFSNVIRQENIDYRLAIQEISVIDFDSSTELSSLRQA